MRIKNPYRTYTRAQVPTYLVTSHSWLASWLAASLWRLWLGPESAERGERRHCGPRVDAGTAENSPRICMSGLPRCLPVSVNLDAREHTSIRARSSKVARGKGERMDKKLLQSKEIDALKLVKGPNTRVTISIKFVHGFFGDLIFLYNAIARR